MNTAEKLTREQNLKLIEAVGGTAGAHQVIAGSKVVVNRFPTTLLVNIGKKHRKGFASLPELLERNSVYLHSHSVLALTGLGFKVSKVESSSIELVSICPQDLGQKDGASQGAFFARALEFGLGMCPHETAVQILLQTSSDWLISPSLTVASMPIIYFVNDVKLESMLQIRAGRIDTCEHHPQRFIYPDDYFFFTRL